MATTEHTINDALAGALRETRRAWRESDIVRSENTGTLRGSAKRPDILVTEPNVSPVVIETEILPAITVEAEAIERLGEVIRQTGRTILSSVAVRLPLRLRGKQGKALHDEITTADDVEMVLYTGSNSTVAARWPNSGWLRGDVSDLSILAQSASVPPDVIEVAANLLVNGVSEAAGLIGDMAATHPGAIHKISTELHQEDGEQTRRMATTILANAFVFQESLAGGPGELALISSIEELRASEGLTKFAVLAEWRNILRVNYWPIFDIARRILQIIPTDQSKPLIEHLTHTAAKLVENRLMRSHDLTGAVFQKLIADRKFLAAYYTTPASAALLVGLALGRTKLPSGGSWSNADDVKNLRIADFACGTGTLLSTAYQRIGQLHELAGGDSEALHPAMMAESLVGCDVLPAASHLTASMLSGTHPTVKYTQSCVLTVAYGKQPEGGVALGSLDLLDPQRKFDIVDITAKSVEGMGEGEKEVWSSLPHASFDFVVMNPPFTRATGHEGKKLRVPNPMFAAFSSTEEEQRLMGRATSQLTTGTSAHGNAGEASIFLVLGDRKLKNDGVLALVMPLSLVSGDAWQKSRTLLARNYADLILVSIAGTDDVELSFSADTGMGECLLFGRKDKTGSKRATFVILDERPHFPMVGASTAIQICRLIEQKKLRRLEDGPVGGTPIHFGDDIIGHALSAPLSDKNGWNLARIADLSLAQTAYQLVEKGRLWLPTATEATAPTLPISTVAMIATIGPYHADINGTNADGSIRGPLEILPAAPGSAPTYPVLWTHDAGRERTLGFEGDSEGQPKKGRNAKEQDVVEAKLASIWASASHCHFSREFRFNSQSTGMQYTHRRTIGGRSWLSIRLTSEDLEKALAAWANTSFGLLLHWWHANKQQSGRGSIGKSALQSLPVHDVTAVTSEALNAATKIFDEMCDKPLLPLHEIDRDSIRRELDERYGREVLNLPAVLFAPGGPVELLRLKLAREPSIRGSK